MRSTLKIVDLILGIEGDRKVINFFCHKLSIFGPNNIFCYRRCKRYIETKDTVYGRRSYLISDIEGNKEFLYIEFPSLIGNSILGNSLIPSNV